MTERIVGTKRKAQALRVTASCNIFILDLNIFQPPPATVEPDRDRAIRSKIQVMMPKTIDRAEAMAMLADKVNSV